MSSLSLSRSRIELNFCFADIASFLSLVGALERQLSVDTNREFRVVQRLDTLGGGVFVATGLDRARQLVVLRDDAVVPSRRRHSLFRQVCVSVCDDCSLLLLHVCID